MRSEQYRIDSSQGRVCGGVVAVMALLLGLGGCRSEAPTEATPTAVVVYTALDREFSEPILKDFTSKTGIVVRPKYDTESTKTVGLVEEIIAERARPRCDLFWNNEILNTLRLERLGLLRAYDSPAARPYPANVKSPDGLWYGFAARARVLIANTNQLPPERRPESIRDLVDPQWYDRAGIAKPLFGTTATHAACLFAVWGDDEAEEFFLGVKRNCRIMSGNKQVAQAVGAGTLAFGLTDTDDALTEVEHGMPVEIIYPDQEEGGLGTLFIPSTLALVKGSPHPRAAEQLLDYLLTPEVEQRLSEGPSAQIPLQPGVPASPRVKTPGEVRTMDIDFAAAAAKWDAAAKFLRDEFTAAN